ncbi:hypothetical protein [Devosia ginsengisoli]|uniref:hypothetical protein n=1 Tax=Devosia ginsengisoli TaxID=400770 RepID=UPI0026EEE0D4|nr:hypothetical protein [Devosia ginsengisoli]MCR6673258.1 hypothetical protein [Devosia ginsengisoli]
MADIAEIAKRAHDTGFEQGSIATINAILAYLDATQMAVSAVAIRKAWESGEIAKLAGLEMATPAEPSAADPAPAPTPPAILLTPPKISREQARGAGYTGDVCTNCQSLQVKRNGSCLVCESCGQTTGCS